MTFFRERLLRRAMQKSVGGAVIDSLRLSPERWVFDEYHARNGAVMLWIANRPYADLTTQGVRIGTRGQRRAIRLLMDGIKLQRLCDASRTVHLDPGQQEVDRVVKKLMEHE